MRSVKIKPSALLPRALRAIQTLETRKTKIAQEHNERIKKLRGIADRLVNSHFEFDVEAAEGNGVGVTPEMLRLIDNPEEGL